MHRARTTTAALAAGLILAISLSGTAGAGTKPAVIHVDDDAAPGGDGSGLAPYNNLAPAVAAARTRPGSVIKVEPGDYPQSSTLFLDVSLDLRGSTKQVANGGDPWPTGEVVESTQTRVFATSTVGSQPLVRVGRADGTVVRDVGIRGLVLEGTAAGIEMLVTRVQGFRVAENVFRAPGNFAFQSVASSGQFIANHMSGVGTGAIFTGGYPASPSSIVATGNRAVRNSIGGMLLNGASINIPELGDELNAVVKGNDLSNNVLTQGFGLRVFILRRDPGAPGDTQSSARVHALVQDNRIDGNLIGVVVDAGFPQRSVGGVCDARTFSGAIDLELAGNRVTGSLVTPALVTFGRSLASLDPSILPLWQYLHGTTFDISDRDGTLANAWLDHPASDPFVGPCPGDASQEPLGNVLNYNGSVLANGKNF